MRAELRELIARVFTVALAGVDEGSSPDTIPAWDSLGHLQMVSAIESHYAVRFNLREIQTMDSVASIEAVLEARGR